MGRDGRHAIPVTKGHDGRHRMAELPPSNIKRWVPQRKAAVVNAVRDGLITLGEACERYALTVEEFLSWEEAIDSYGLEGLRVNELCHHRHVH